MPPPVFGLAIGRLTISRTYRKHCIHFSGPHVPEAGIGCPCRWTPESALPASVSEAHPGFARRQHDVVVDRGEHGGANEALRPGASSPPVEMARCIQAAEVIGRGRTLIVPPAIARSHPGARVVRVSTSRISDCRRRRPRSGRLAIRSGSRRCRGVVDESRPPDWRPEARSFTSCSIRS